MPGDQPKGNAPRSSSADDGHETHESFTSTPREAGEHPTGATRTRLRIDWPSVWAWLSTLGHATWATAAGSPDWLRVHSFFPSWLPRRWRHPLSGYGAAILIQVASVMLTAWLLDAAPPFPFPGTITLLGVVVVALMFGAGPSLAAALLGSALLLTLVLPRPWGWLLLNASIAFAIGVVISIAIIMSALVSRSEHARQEAVAATQARDTFLSLAAHELRTPLTAFMGSVELARLRMRRLATTARQHQPLQAVEVQEIAELLVKADAAAQLQNRLVEELLDVARIQVGTLTFQFAPYDLGAIVRAAVEDQQRLQPGRALRMDVPVEPVVVDADRERIRQVVTNFLLNALKFAPPNQPIDVLIRVAADRALVAVQDRGPGLPPDEQARAWELYHRVPGIEVANGSSVGLGLGLHLCRAIVQGHRDGQVGVDSVVGEGSTFWFRLPLAESHPEQPSATQ